MIRSSKKLKESLKCHRVQIYLDLEKIKAQTNNIKIIKLMFFLVNWFFPKNFHSIILNFIMMLLKNRK